MTQKMNYEASMSPSHPFDETTCNLASDLKTAGLKWIPRVGHYVWDSNKIINYPSPFPGRIYFILNINRFLDIFKTIDRMTEELIWLPDWHQSREICKDLKIDDTLIKNKLCEQDSFDNAKDLHTIYGIILSFLGTQ